MLNKILKIAQIGFLSGSLLFLDFTAKAADLYGGASTQTTPNNSMATSEAQVETKTTPNSGDNVATNLSDKKTFKSNEISDFNLTSTLFMMGAGLVVSRLMTCKMTPDMIAAAAGGAAFVAGEALAFVKIKKALKKFEIDYNEKANSEELKKQVDSFVKLKKSYEEAKDTANTKITLQKAAAAAFVIAAGLALKQYMAEKVALKTCTTALKTASTACSVAFTASCAGGATCQYPLQTGAMQAAAAIPVTLVNQAAEEVPAPSAGQVTTAAAKDAANLTQIGAAASQCPKVSAGLSACNAYMAVKKAGNGVCPISPAIAMQQLEDGRLYIDPKDIMKHNPTFMTKMMEALLMPSANASALQALGVAGSAAVIYVVATSKTLGIKMDLLLFNPRNRAMLWGVFAGFTYAATSGTQNVIAEIDKNIQKIDEILQMHHEQGFGRELAKNAADDKNKQDKGEIDKDGLDGKNNQGRVNSGKSSNQNVNKENESITLDEPLPCYTGPDAKNCRSFSDTLAGLKSFNSLDSGTKKQLMSLATGLNGVNGTQTISGATLNSAAEIGANSQALNKTMAAMKKELKDGYTLKGKKASLDEVGKELDKDFLSVVNDGARAQNMTPRQLMASIQGTTPSALTFDSKKEVEGDLKKEGEGDLKALSLGEFLSGDELNNADANALSENDLNKEGAGTSNDKSLQLTSGKDDVKDNAIDLSQYDINDISKEGNNLFEVISKRYQKSAYTRLFPKLNEKVNAVEEKKK